MECEIIPDISQLNWELHLSVHQRTTALLLWNCRTWNSFGVGSFHCLEFRVRVGGRVSFSSVFKTQQKGVVENAWKTR